MLAKVLATLSLLGLPFSLALWHRSHSQPQQYRSDLTLDKSVWVFLKDGTCGIQVTSLPTKTPSRSEFRASMVSTSWTPIKQSLALRTETKGRSRILWLAFPLWLPNLALSLICAASLLHGPFRTWWRKSRGHCAACGYDLQGLHGHRCPECGNAFHLAAQRP